MPWLISFPRDDSDDASALRGVGYACGVSLTSFPLRLLVLLAVFSLSGCGCSSAALSDEPDGEVPSGPADVIAIAGPDLVVLEGSRVVLAGGASRALVGEPTLSWLQQEGPAVVLSDPSSSSPAFIAPLSPARLVFVLEATTAGLRDLDRVVVDVVDTAAAVPTAPASLVPFGDRAESVDVEVVIDERWTGRGAPLVDIRCEGDITDGPLVVGGRLQVSFTPFVLPCPFVVDDDADALGAGRAAFTIWPAGTGLGAATRADAPAIVGPGSVVDVEVDVGTRLFFVDGRALALTPTSSGQQFTAPSTPGRLTLVAEARQGNTSGGLRVVPIVVAAGDDNQAPVIDGGADLRVRPGARFRIAPVVIDDDGDDVTITVRQVLGATAQQLGGGVGVLQAPSVPQTLLFHVVAGDGIAESAVEPVRVVVDAGAENQPPVLSIPAELYVVPGGTFVVDATSARDPDTGLLASTRIAQEAGDAVQLLTDVVDAPAVTLTAGAAGEVYRFVISAVDDDGLETPAALTVYVEEAGPYVDVIRGFPDGVGTVGRPFDTIAAALATAARHRFGVLQLASGALNLEALPDGLGLVGGQVFVAGAYVDAGASTVLTLNGPVEVAAARLSRLVFAGETGALRLRRRVTLDDVDVATPLAILAGARVDVLGGSLTDVAVTGAIVDFFGVDVIGGIAAEGGTLVVRGGTITSSAGPALAVVGGALTTTDVAITAVGSGIAIGAGTVASLGGIVDVVGTSGVDIDGGTVDFADLDVHVHGAASAAGITVDLGAVSGRVVVVVDDVGVGVGVASGTAPLGGTLGGSVSVDARVDATGVAIFDGALERLRVSARAPAAVGIVGRRVEARAVVVLCDGDGVRVNAGELRHVTIAVGATAVLVADGAVALRNVALRAGVGVIGAVDLGVVGFAGDENGTCVGCLIAPSATIDAVTGALAADAVLGGANAFVDAGAAGDAVAFDVDGKAVPQGAGPDLGAIERD